MAEKDMGKKIELDIQSSIAIEYKCNPFKILYCCCTL